MSFDQLSFFHSVHVRRSSVVCRLVLPTVLGTMTTLACNFDSTGQGDSGGAGSTTQATSTSGGPSTTSGGPSTTSGGPSTTSGANGSTASGILDSWGEYCTDVVARDAMCDPANPPSPSLAECSGAEACFRAMIRADAVDALTHCLATRPCDKSDDQCVNEVSAQVAPTPEAQAYMSACTQKRAACASSFSDDWCVVGSSTPVGIFTQSVYADLQNCLADDCSDVLDCLNGTIDALAEPCGGSLGF